MGLSGVVDTIWYRANFEGLFIKNGPPVVDATGGFCEGHGASLREYFITSKLLVIFDYAFTSKRFSKRWGGLSGSVF